MYLTLVYSNGILCTVRNKVFKTVYIAQRFNFQYRFENQEITFFHQAIVIQCVDFLPCFDPHYDNNSGGII